MAAAPGAAALSPVPIAASGAAACAAAWAALPRPASESTISSCSRTARCTCTGCRTAVQGRRRRGAKVVQARCKSGTGAVQARCRRGAGIVPAVASVHLVQGEPRCGARLRRRHRCRHLCGCASPRARVAGRARLARRLCCCVAAATAARSCTVAATTTAGRGRARRELFIPIDLGGGGEGRAHERGLDEEGDRVRRVEDVEEVARRGPHLRGDGER